MGFPLLWALSALCSSALAQAPGLTASLTAGATDARWIAPAGGAAEITSKRFFGEEIAGPVFKSGEEVEIILTDGDRARIRQGPRYGWVSVADLATSQPLMLPPSLGEMPAGLLGAPPGGNPLLGGLPSLVPAPVPAAPAPAPNAP